jgi:hypothetical protein
MKRVWLSAALLSLLVEPAAAQKHEEERAKMQEPCCRKF